MKNTNKHLDDLFAAARQGEPIISEENARELLAKSEHVQASPFIFSTKGIIMSTIGLSLAAFTAYILLSGSPQAPVTHITAITKSASNLFAHSTNPNIDKPKKSDAKITEVNGDTSPTPATPPVPPIPPIPHLPAMISTPLKVSGIKPMILPQEKYAKMGVSKREDGTVTFSQKNESGKIFSMSFPQNTWGILIGDEKLNEITDAPHFAPLIVTDTKGNKRMMQFSNNSGGMKTKAINIISRADNDSVNLDLSDIEGALNQSLKVSGITIDKDSSKHMKIDYNEMNIKIDSKNSNQIPSKNNKVISIKKIVRFDSLIKSQSWDELNEMVKEFSRDSIFKNKSIHVHIGEDDINFGNDEIDNAYSDRDIIDSMTSVADKALESMSTELGNLVPILVRSATREHFNKEEGITYDDGLIFWYNPDKDLFATVPEAQSSVSPSQSMTSGIISKAVLYPNPAKNKTTLHFDLSEPRTIAFSVHDLLGKRVLDGGSIRETSAGSYAHEFDLSELTPGVYLLVITTDKGEQSMQRLVIQK